MEYKIIKTLIRFPTTGEWQKELNLVQWGKLPPRYDLRRWNKDHTKMSKGITLSEEEMQILKEKIGGIV